MNVIPFPHARSRASFTRPVEPPPALGRPLLHTTGTEDETDFEDRKRMQQNLAACLLVVGLLIAGAWMIERLKAYSRTLACLEAGHRYCTVLDPRHLPGR